MLTTYLINIFDAAFRTTINIQNEIDAIYEKVEKNIIKW
jgi:hypothetical protein